MTEENKKKCPTCMGEKIIPGVCESSGEWSGADDDMGAQCTPDEACPTCNGKGYVIEE